MRADTISAKTWLLGAAAAWALCACLLALLGMGGGVTMLAEDPALLQPLPQAGKPPPERLGPLPQQSEIGRPPLHTSDRSEERRVGKERTRTCRSRRSAYPSKTH